MKKIICLFLIVLTAWPLMGTGAADTEVQKDKEKKKRTVPLTLFIPGIHQLQHKRYVKGTLLLGAFAGAIAGALTYNAKGNQWYRKYSESSNVEDIIAFRDHTEKNFRKRNYYLVGIGVIWLVHIVDVKIFNSGKGGVTGEVGNNNLNVGIYYSF